MRSARPAAHRKRIANRTSLLLGAILLHARPAIAQTVAGHITSTTNGAPVAGAIVALLDSTGRAVITGLAEDDGSYRLTSPVSGRYSVRVERVGFRSSTSTSVIVAQGTTVDLPITLAAEGVSLRAVRVSADRRCIVRPKEGLAAAQLWDEARKALRATELTQMAQAAARSRRDPHLFMVRTRRFARDLAPGSLNPTHEEQLEVEGETITPFVTEDAEVLERDGYLAGAIDTGAVYFAPDATILLSDRFLDAHCFRVDEMPRQSREDLIGLAFEPAHLTRETSWRKPHVEISGVLWLDRSTAELRYMEFHYVGLPFVVPKDAAAGLLEFRPLPDGRWIVWRWYVRAPRMLQRQASEPYANMRIEPHLELKNIHEEGAEILEVMPPGSRRPALAAIRGVVSDSVLRSPLAGVRVFLSGTSFAAMTAADGSYMMDAIPPGKYSISVLASRFDSLLLEPPARELMLSAGKEQLVNLAVPSVRSLSRRLCPDAAPQDSASILVGVVRDTSDTSDATAPGARVRAEWHEFSKPSSEQLMTRPLAVETNAIAGGRFALCGLPANTRIMVEARRGRNRATGLVLHFNPGEVRRQDLRLHAP